MGLLEVSLLYGLASSCFKTIFALMAAIVIFVAFCFAGLVAGSVDWLSALGMFVSAWLTLNLGFATRVLMPAIRPQGRTERA